MSAIFGLSSMGFDNLWTVHMQENLTFPVIGDFKPVVWFGIFNIVVSLLGLAGTELVTRKVAISQQRSIVQTLTFMSSATAVCMVVFGLTGKFFVGSGDVLFESYLADNQYAPYHDLDQPKC